MGFRRVGFFREQYDGDPALPSLREAVRADPHPDAARLVPYLEAGVGLAGAGCYARDLLAPEPRYIASPGLSTDGLWLWRDDLPYYVARYHVALPDEFVAHARGNGWAVPALSRREVSRLSRELYQDMGGT